MEQLIQTRNELDEIIREVYHKLDDIISQIGFKTSSGETITTWLGLLDEHTKNEIALKNWIKEGNNLDETKYFAIRKKISYEYDAMKARLIAPGVIEGYIETKEVINKTALDKAIKKKEVTEELKKALVEKSVSISFIDKEKVKSQEEKEFTLD